MVSYAEIRAQAQADANRLRRLYRLWKNPYASGGYSVSAVPWLCCQFGSDRVGELIEPEKWEDALFARGPHGDETSDPERAYQLAVKSGAYQKAVPTWRR